MEPFAENVWCVGECPVDGPGSEVLALFTDHLVFYCCACGNCMDKYVPGEIERIAPLPPNARPASLGALLDAGYGHLTLVEDRTLRTLQLDLADAARRVG